MPEVDDWHDEHAVVPVCEDERPFALAGKETCVVCDVYAQCPAREAEEPRRQPRDEFFLFHVGGRRYLFPI